MSAVLEFTSTEFTSTYTLIFCGECDVKFAVPDEWLRRRKDDHTTWYCPNGHARHYPAPRESREQRLERALGYARAAQRAAQDQAQAAERSARAYKGVATRVKRRAAHGVCPVPGCKRSFADVARHVAGQHPEFVAETGSQS